jgi:hypothetical protein
MGINAGVWIDHHRRSLSGLRAAREARGKSMSDVENLARLRRSTLVESLHTGMTLWQRISCSASLASDLNKYYERDHHVHSRC